MERVTRDHNDPVPRLHALTQFGNADESLEDAVSRIYRDAVSALPVETRYRINQYWSTTAARALENFAAQPADAAAEALGDQARLKLTAFAYDGLSLTDFAEATVQAKQVRTRAPEAATVNTAVKALVALMVAQLVVLSAVGAAASTEATTFVVVVAAFAQITGIDVKTIINCFKDQASNDDL